MVDVNSNYNASNSDGIVHDAGDNETKRAMIITILLFPWLLSSIIIVINTMIISWQLFHIIISLSNINVAADGDNNKRNVVTLQSLSSA